MPNDLADAIRKIPCPKRELERWQSISPLAVSAVEATWEAALDAAAALVAAPEPADLEGIRTEAEAFLAKQDAATAGPWFQSCGRNEYDVATEARAYDSAEQVRYGGSPVCECDIGTHGDYDDAPANSTFIVHARNSPIAKHVLSLLSRLAAAEAERDAIAVAIMGRSENVADLPDIARAVTEERGEAMQKAVELEEQVTALSAALDAAGVARERGESCTHCIHGSNNPRGCGYCNGTGVSYRRPLTLPERLAMLVEERGQAQAKLARVQWLVDHGAVGEGPCTEGYRVALQAVAIELKGEN